MPKDYAKYNAKRRTRKKARANNVLFICFFIFLISGLGWIIIKKYPVSEVMQNMKVWISHHKNSKNTTIVKNAIHENTQPTVHFAFYNELPNMQVPVSSTTIQSPVQTEKSFYSLRFGEFKDENEASQMRLSLLLTGIDSEIVRSGDHFKVRQGNFPTLMLAKAMQKKLEKKGIETVIEK